MGFRGSPGGGLRGLDPGLGWLDVPYVSALEALGVLAVHVRPGVEVTAASGASLEQYHVTNSVYSAFAGRGLLSVFVSVGL